MFAAPCGLPAIYVPNQYFIPFSYPGQGTRGGFSKKNREAPTAAEFFRLLWALFFYAQNQKWAGAQRLVRWAYPLTTGGRAACQGFGRTAAKLAAISGLWKLSALTGGVAPGIALSRGLWRLPSRARVRACVIKDVLRPYYVYLDFPRFVRKPGKRPICPDYKKINFSSKFVDIFLLFCIPQI